MCNFRVFSSTVTADWSQCARETKKSCLLDDLFNSVNFGAFTTVVVDSLPKWRLCSVLSTSGRRLVFELDDQAKQSLVDDCLPKRMKWRKLNLVVVVEPSATVVNFVLNLPSQYEQQRRWVINCFIQYKYEHCPFFRQNGLAGTAAVGDAACRLGLQHVQSTEDALD